MTIVSQGDVVSYDNGTTVKATAQGVYILGNAASSTPPGIYSAVKQEDVSALDGDYGSASLWVRRDTNIVVTNADGDYTNPAVNSAGSVKIVGDTLPATTDAGTSPIKIGGIYSVTPSTLTDGQRGNLQVGTRGSLNVTLFGADSTNSPTVVNSGSDASSNTIGGLTVYARPVVYNGTTWDRARGDTVGAYIVETPTGAAANALTPQATTVAASSLVLKASAGNLYGYNVVTGASAGYLMIFNATTAPADGTVTPTLCIPIAANTGVDRQFAKPKRFTTGITMVFSTTGPFTKTASATAFLEGEAI